MSGLTTMLIPLHAEDGSVRAHALVDAEDYERLAVHRWSFDGAAGYARRGEWENGKTRTIRMHREIMGLIPGDGLEADHVSRDKLDNRRENLRVVTHAQQMQNVPAIGGTSRHRGVSLFHNGRWRATCQIDRKQHHVGYFADEEDAARAVSAYRREHMPFSIEEIT